MVKKKEPEKEPSNEAIIEEPQPQKKGLIAAMLPLLAGVVLMIGSAWAFTEFFLLEKITEKLADVNLEMKDHSVKDKENPKPENKHGEVKPEDRDFLENMIAGVEKDNLPDTQKKEWEAWQKKKKEKFEGPFETDQFNQTTTINGESRYLLARFEIDNGQSRAHREKLYQILTDKKSFINAEALNIVSNKSFKNLDELDAYKRTAEAMLTARVKEYVTNEELTFVVLTTMWTTN